VKDMDFGVDFVAGNSNKLQKLGLEGKNQLSPQCVHIAEVRKIKSVFHTWAKGTQATLV